MKHKISDLQAQLANSEKAMTEQKRLLSTVKDEYEEKFKVGLIFKIVYLSEIVRTFKK